MNSNLNKHSLYLLAFFCMFLVFIPKVNILSFENETAGLRIDDFILFFFALLLGISFIYNNKKITEIEIWVFYILLLSTLSFFVNQLLVIEGVLSVNSKIFYVIRIIEYFLFFYIGQMSFRFLSLRTILSSFIVLNVFMMLFQKLGFIGKITDLGPQNIDIERVSGIASFPAEMGGLLNIIFCYFLINKPASSNLFHVKFPVQMQRLWNQTREFRLFLLFLALTALTGARIAVASIFLIYLLYFLMKNNKNIFKLILVSTLVFITILPITYLIIVNTEGIFSRSSQLLSTNNFKIITETWNQIDTNIQLNDNIHMTSGNYDMSWWIRLHKWCYALKTYFNHPECYLQGIGPGAFTAALDGGLLRILTECGIVGCILYWKFFNTIYTQSETMKWIMISIFLNMIFFDFYLSYKTMSLLFFISGYNKESQKTLFHCIL